MYRDRKTGEPLEKVTDWELSPFGCLAYFKALDGATFTMSKRDVIKEQL